MKNELGVSFSTKDALCMAMLLGYERYKGNGFTKSEMGDLARLYDFDLSEVNALTAAGNTRNMYRFAERDGLRVMAFLSRYCEHGEDPVRVVAEGLASLGYDVMIGDDNS